MKFSTVDFTCAVPSAANWAQSLWLECITQSTNTLNISFPIDLPWLSLTCLSFSNFKCGLSAPVCQTAPFLPWLKCDHLGISAPVSALWGPSPDVVSLTLLGSSLRNPLSSHVNFRLHIWVILPMYPHCLDLISYVELGLHWNQS